MRSPRPIPPRLVAALTAVFVLISAAYGLAQFRGSRNVTASIAPDPLPDADFVICRLVYPEGQRFAQGWQTDWPLGETPIADFQLSDADLAARLGQGDQTLTGTSGKLVIAVLRP